MINGLVAFPITPMDADGRVDAVALGRLVRAAIEAGVDAVCVLGSTGAYAYLSREERRRAIEAAAEHVDGSVPLLAGVGALRTDMAVHHVRDARQAGAAMGLLAPMSYTPLTGDEVFAHFETVAAEGGLPLCVYDNPVATHFSISDDLFARLAALPNVLAVKSPAPSADAMSQRLAALRTRAPARVSIRRQRRRRWHRSADCRSRCLVQRPGRPVSGAAGSDPPCCCRRQYGGSEAHRTGASPDVGFVQKFRSDPGDLCRCQPDRRLSCCGAATDPAAIRRSPGDRRRYDRAPGIDPRRRGT